MRKCKITVYDRDHKLPGVGNFRGHSKNPPTKYEVEAWCVGGDEGVKAFFLIDDMLCMANGDDGNWWMIDVCHKNWLKEIKEAINAVSDYG